MQFGKAVLSGIVLWAVMFALASILMALGLLTSTTAFHIVMWVLALIAIWLIVEYWYRPADITDAFVAGLIWLIITALLEYFVTVQYFLKGDVASYYGWGIWVGYAIILLWPPVLKALKK